ncbi:VOC family protein [Sphingomonas crocodyli]|uniref:Lactoylglutathione lyase n=1 Tax=Sphingomonas crocodyli TaxID=1979270 RepID=A0A437M9X4_9SPHN|nr:VOC family protein [Sphingomonas crocodyli]RVT94438.1 lactoylglutathione lyase [Sphingomonas crocodyli]
MAQMIFVNLPVTDLARSIAFYEAVGFTADQQFRDDRAQMMTLSENIHVMIMTYDRFADFTPKAIPDAKTSAQVLICTSADSRDDVDAIIGRAAAAGAKLDPTPQQDMGGFMYGRSYEDPDGHIFEVMWMDVAAATAAFEAQPA